MGNSESRSVLKGVNNAPNHTTSCKTWTCRQRKGNNMMVNTTLFTLLVLQPPSGRIIIINTFGRTNCLRRHCVGKQPTYRKQRTVEQSKLITAQYIVSLFEGSQILRHSAVPWDINTLYQELPVSLILPHSRNQHTLFTRSSPISMSHTTLKSLPQTRCGNP